MLLKRLVFSTSFISFTLVTGWLSLAQAGICPETSSKSELFFVDNDGEVQNIKRNVNGTYRLDGDVFEWGRRLKFFGKIKQTYPDNDFMVVIKVRGTTEAASEKNSKTVRLLRPSQHRKDKGFESTNYSLEKYSKHHFPDENGNAEDNTLKYKFHTPYKVAGKWHQTDDSYDKKKLFQFEGLGNTWRGNFFTRLLTPNRADALTTTKFVYLQAEIQNLKSSPCFEFKTFVPRTVDDLLIQVIPIDSDQRYSLDPWGKRWPFKREEN